MPNKAKITKCYYKFEQSMLYSLWGSEGSFTYNAPKSDLIWT